MRSLLALALMVILVLVVGVLSPSALDTPVTIIQTAAGNGTSAFFGDKGAAAAASLSDPFGVAVDAIGNLYIADTSNHRIRKIDTSGIIATVAGNGIESFSGDGGAATSATLNTPLGVAVDRAGNLYIADAFNNRIRKVNAAGVITTVAGNGDARFSGDHAPATSASLSGPFGVAVDKVGNLYIADTSNHRIRKVDTSGMITTVAGNGTEGFSGEGGPAAQASLNFPTGVTVDSAGNLFITDQSNNRIRKVSTAGVIITVAGNGDAGFSGDHGAATSASLNLPIGTAVDATGTLYIADTSNHRIRRVSVNGIVITVAGNGIGGFSGDGIAASRAALNSPGGVAVDAAGNVYIADSSNNRIRKLNNIPSVPRGARSPGQVSEVQGPSANRFNPLLRLQSTTSSCEFCHRTRVPRTEWIMPTICGRLASIARGVRIATLMGERTNSCRLGGSVLRTRHRFWSDYGPPGSNPQVVDSTDGFHVPLWR